MSSSVYTKFLQTKPFVAVGGIAGSGKTSLVDAVLARPDSPFRRPTSYTTRPQRLGEDNREYSFVSKTEFRELADAGHLLNQDEARGHHYGITRESVEEIHRAGMIPIKEIHLPNAFKLRHAGLTVLEAFVDARSEELASDFSAGLLSPDRLSPTESHPAARPNGYGLTLRRSDGRPEILADRLTRWFRASAELLGANPVILKEAERARERNVVGYDKVSDEFTDDTRVTTRYFHDLTRSFWLDMLTKQMRPGQYLELGPGRGWLRSLRWPAGAHYRGFEISSAMRNLNPDRDFIDLGAADALPYANCSFDGILGSLVDPFLLPNCLVEINRILRCGGWFAGTAPSAAWADVLRNGTAPRTEFVLQNGERLSVSSFCYTVRQLEDCLIQTGFDLVDVTEQTVSDRLGPAPPAIRTAIENAGRDLPITVSWLARRPSALWATNA